MELEAMLALAKELASYSFLTADEAVTAQGLLNSLSVEVIRLNTERDLARQQHELCSRAFERLEASHADLEFDLDLAYQAIDELIDQL